MSRVRLDILMVERDLAETREKAQALIRAGHVLVDGQRADKPGRSVSPDATITLRSRLPYVSRGGLKLEAALASFALDVQDAVVVDVGASTGGFTDCLLQRGARRVYAIDVGYGQLAWTLRQDPRVVVMERMNIRFVEGLPEPADLATVDVSFIGLELVLPPVQRLLRPGGGIVALVKPQFEAGRAEVGKGGVVRDPVVHRRVLERIVSWAGRNGLSVAGIIPSPITGPSGNVEFLLHLLPFTSEEDVMDPAPLIDACLASVSVKAPLKEHEPND
jgi:23S rRNA (cytidine1920-2'-O)/16S rRNA (cytidine1409-2'-O)-methyltransferase